MLAVCCVVLAVSLSHLAWAVRDITGSARWQSWFLAAAVDISLVSPSPKYLSLCLLNPLAVIVPPSVRTQSAERENVCWSSCGPVRVSHRAAMARRRSKGGRRLPWMT